MLRPGLLLIVLAACGHAPERPALLSNRAQVTAGGIAAGAYACRLDESGYAYPPFRCVVEARGTRTWLEKTEGSVRLRGWITKQGDGFAFDGELYCPWGDCTERVSTVFAADGAGGYRGALHSAQSGTIVVTMAYVSGAAGVGGDGYGGGAYGGGATGGNGYGGDSPPVDDP